MQEMACPYHSMQDFAKKALVPKLDSYTVHQ